MTHKWIRKSDGTWQKLNLKTGKGFIYNSCPRCNERPADKCAVAESGMVGSISFSRMGYFCEVCVNRKQLDSMQSLI